MEDIKATAAAAAAGTFVNKAKPQDVARWRNNCGPVSWARIFSRREKEGMLARGEEVLGTQDRANALADSIAAKHFRRQWPDGVFVRMPRWACDIAEEGGYKMHGVGGIFQMFSLVIRGEEPACHAYEILEPEGKDPITGKAAFQPAQIHLDIDLNRVLNPDADGIAVIKNVVEVLKDYVQRKVLPKDAVCPEPMVLSASNSRKVSFHVLLPVYMKNSLHAAEVARRLVTEELDSPEHRARFFFKAQRKIHGSDGEMEIFDDCVIDSAIGTVNRPFRLLGCTKKGPGRTPLRVIDIHTATTDIVEHEAEITPELFTRALVQNWDGVQPIYTFYDKSGAEPMSSSIAKPVSMGGTGERINVHRGPTRGVVNVRSTLTDLEVVALRKDVHSEGGIVALYRCIWGIDTPTGEIQMEFASGGRSKRREMPKTPELFMSSFAGTREVPHILHMDVSPNTETGSTATVFDIDEVPALESKTCCRARALCSACFPVMRLATEILRDLLINRYRIAQDDIKVFFSGRRGTHLWVYGLSNSFSGGTEVQFKNLRETLAADYASIWKADKTVRDGIVRPICRTSCAGTGLSPKELAEAFASTREGTVTIPDDEAEIPMWLCEAVYGVIDTAVLFTDKHMAKLPLSRHPQTKRFCAYLPYGERVDVFDDAFDVAGNVKSFCASIAE